MIVVADAHSDLAFLHQTQLDAKKELMDSLAGSSREALDAAAEYQVGDACQWREGIIVSFTPSYSIESNEQIPPVRSAPARYAKSFSVRCFSFKISGLQNLIISAFLEYCTKSPDEQRSLLSHMQR